MEPQINDINISDLAQGEASIVGDKPSELKHPGQTKARVNYSGAAKRRYKKMQAALRASEDLANPAVTPATPREEGSVAGMGAKKRPKPDHSTPSPSAQTHQGKKPKVSNQGSYAQMTNKNLVRMAFILEGYPDKKLDSGDLPLIRKRMKEGILEFPEGTRHPTFEGVFERDGAVMVLCSDEISAEWLKGLTSGFTVGGGVTYGWSQPKSFPSDIGW